MAKQEIKKNKSNKGNVGAPAVELVDMLKDAIPLPSLDKKMDEVISGINTLAGAIGKLVDMQTARPLADRITAESAILPVKEFIPKLDDETYPSDYVPSKFRRIVDAILSKEFGLTIVDFDDRTDFQVNIIVPEKYSSVAKEDRDKGILDVRSRIIPRSLGENGIKEWCKLIRLNLNRYYSKEGVQSPFSNIDEL